jgi:hypothetical protein
MNLVTIITYPFLPFEGAVVENITFTANKDVSQQPNIIVLEQFPDAIKEK